MGQPASVSLMDVISAIQGPLLLNRCMGIHACGRQPSCRISASLKPFQNALNVFLRSTSLSDIVAGPTGRSNADRTRVARGVIGGATKGKRSTPV